MPVYRWLPAPLLPAVTPLIRNGPVHRYVQRRGTQARCAVARTVQRSTLLTSTTYVVYTRLLVEGKRGRQCTNESKHRKKHYKAMENNEAQRNDNQTEKIILIIEYDTSTLAQREKRGSFM
jgi:hypothetical protein